MAALTLNRAALHMAGSKITKLSGAESSTEQTQSKNVTPMSPHVTSPTAELSHPGLQGTLPDCSNGGLAAIGHCLVPQGWVSFQAAIDYISINIWLLPYSFYCSPTLVESTFLLYS